MLDLPSASMSQTRPHAFQAALGWLGIALLATAWSGCSTRPSVVDKTEPTNDPAMESPVAPQGNSTGGTTGNTMGATAAASQRLEGDIDELSPEAYIVEADALLAATLSPDQLEQGWVRLFDGQSLAGWFAVGDANWQIKDNAIKVSRGEASFLCTSFVLADYELKVDFRCNPDTNSGVFLRSTPQPMDVEFDCIELNIAPPDNPFPTGSLVKRQRVEPESLGAFDPTQWHTYHVRLDGEQVLIRLDDQLILETTDSTTSRRGHICLQFNQGHVEFRNILLRPLATQPLKVDENWEEDWTKSEREPETFKVLPGADGLRLVGGLGQLQSNRDFGDFMLQARYTLAAPEVNSGIFFRCIRDSMLDGYECQVNHATIDGDPLQPADAGAGAIFRRQPARIVVGDGTSPTYLTLLASGQQMVTWVNGLQVVDFVDNRPPDENPRRGSRTEPGPIALQGHDPSTDLVFHALDITELR
jgi:hypothetical protein